jgi:transposase-like protein
MEGGEGMSKSPCCNAERRFIKEQQELDGTCSNVKYQCTGCGKEYWEYFEDPGRVVLP